MNHKPSVFPTQEQRLQAARNAERSKLEEYEYAKIKEATGIYQSSVASPDTPYEHLDAVEQMKRRTEEQLRMRNESGNFDGLVQHPELAESITNPRVIQNNIYSKSEEQMKIRDEQFEKNRIQMENYQKRANEASVRNNLNPNAGIYPQNDTSTFENRVPPIVPPKPPINNEYPENYGKNPSSIDSYIVELSQPNYNSPYDTLPLPSEGKLNRGCRESVRVGFMTTADENILTSPNILESGRFLDILINRKIMEPSLRYKDLHIGDRNAIMIWLRATAYGEMYPVTLFDENDVPFDTEINLNELKTKNLSIDPDEEGLFYYQFQLCRAHVKFKLLTCGDVDEVERLVELDKSKGLPIDNSNIYTMERIIKEVNGERSRDVIKAFCNSIRIGDAKSFNTYIESIESGIDLNIEVRTPGGGSIKTFLPLNLNFFWPNVKL